MTTPTSTPPSRSATVARVAFCTRLGLLAPVADAGEVRLAHHGEAQLVLSLPPSASDSLLNSANRLSDKLSAITGATFRQGDPVEDGKGKLILGLRSDYPELLPEATKDKTSTWKERYRLLSKGGNLYVIGETDLAVAHGVADLLHRVGYRYLIPPKAWEVIPSIPSLSIDVDVTEQPAFGSRLLFMGDSGDKEILRASKWSTALSNFGAWRRHMRAFSAFKIRTGHAWVQMARRNADAFDAHPEWLVKGSPDFRDPKVQHNVKFNLEHHDLIELLQKDSVEFLRANSDVHTVSVDPSDGGNWPEASPIGTPSDQVVYLANAVSNAIRDEFPDRKVAFYAYHLHSPPPTLELDPGIIVNVATGFIRGGYTVDELMKGWREKGAELGIREYTNVFFGSWDLPGGSYVGFSPQKSYETVRRFYRNGARYWISETDNAWGAVGPGAYVAFHTLWDPVNGPDAKTLMDDFITKAFGNGAKAMQDYYAVVSPESHPIVSEDLAARMYGALHAALQADLKPEERTRILHLVAYTRFTELMHTFRNSEPGTQAQESYRALVQWSYDAGEFQMFSARGVMASIPRKDPRLNEILHEVIRQPVQVPTEEALAQLLAERLKKVKRITFTARNYVGRLEKPTGEIGEEAIAAPADFAFANRQTIIWQAGEAGEVLPLEIRGLGKRPEIPRPTEVSLKLMDDVLNESAQDVETAADGEWHTVHLKAPIAGLYEISVLTHGGYIELRWPEGTPVVVPTGQVGGSLPYDTWEASFYVPPGTDRIGGYSERARGLLLSESGKVLHDFTQKRGPAYFDVAITPSRKGRLFRFREASGRKILMTVPPYLARRGSEMLIPADAGNPSTSTKK